MKKLSIEEKAKAYDEAIEKAIVAHKDEDKHLRATLERIFTELKESEDEKIKEGLIKYLKADMECNHSQSESFYNKSIAWLEKQGKQKPTDKIEPENTPIEGKFPYNNSSDTLEDEIENIWGKLSCQGLFTATKEGFSEVATHFANYLKKQNPIEWSKEDEDYYDAIIAKLEVTQDDATLTDNQMEFLKSLKDRIGG